MIDPTIVTFDIETCTDPELVHDTAYLDELRESIEAPANYRDPIKIAAYRDEKLTATLDRGALSARTGVVLAIGWADMRHAPIVAAAHDEAEVLGLFFDWLRADVAGPYALAGFRIRDFDLPFVTARAAILGVELPRGWPRANDYRGAVLDIPDAVGREGKCDEWLRAFGCPRKTWSGKESSAACLQDIRSFGHVTTPTLDRVREYCRADVEAERELVRRLIAVGAFPALRHLDPTPQAI